METKIRYAARLTQVRDVTLLGAADWSYWSKRLAAEGLTPTECNGRAQILIIAADAKYLGLRFQELSFSVLVSDSTNGGAREGAFLLQAFNSRRAFAFCERAFFSTPYLAGDVSLSAAYPPSIRLTLGGQTVFLVDLSASEDCSFRTRCLTGDPGWEGPVYLPNRRAGARDGRWFYAKIRGDTRTYPFLPSHDSLVLRSARESAVFQMLLDSHFTGQECSFRQMATHAKSKTYRRSRIASILRAPNAMELAARRARGVGPQSE
jgi:hypothetical protein